MKKERNNNESNGNERRKWNENNLWKYGNNNVKIIRNENWK